MSLAAFSIRRPVTTAMSFIALAMLGLVSLRHLSVELMPEVVYPEIYVTMNLRGASPEQVERDLVMPVEEEIGKLKGVLEIESTATLARGTVRISYQPGTDMRFALLQVQNRVNQLQPAFPEQATASVRRFDAADLTATIMELQVLSDGDINWLRDYAEENIRPELEAVDGIANAVVMGGQQGAVEVIVEPLALQAHGLTLGSLNNALSGANQPRSYLGRVYDGAQAYPVSAQTQVDDLRALRRTVVRADAGLRLEDVADVRMGLQTRTDLSRVNGMAAVAVRLQKEDEANLISVAAAVQATVDRLNRLYAPAGVELLVTSSQAAMMESALGTLKRAALIGLALALAVLFVFLRNLRFVAVLLLAVPASLLITFNLMYAWNISLNVLSLCGLALAIGMLTDNSIVVMESIFKHHERGKPALVAARDGTDEVSRAVIASTLSTVLVFLPVVFVRSDYQDILRQLALAITFPLLASLLVALSLVPAVAGRALARGVPRALRTGRLMAMYTVLLKAGLRHRARVGLGVALVLVVTLLASFMLMLQQEVVQEESRFTVYVELPAGATLEETDDIVRQVEAAVQELPGVDRFTASVQEGSGSVTVLLVPPAQRPDRVPAAQIRQQLEPELMAITAATVGFEPAARAAGGRGSGGMQRQSGGFDLQAAAPREQVVIRGYDFHVLQMLADDLTYRLEGLEEIEANSVRSDARRSAPEAQVVPLELALFDRNLTIRQVLAAVEEASSEGTRARTGMLLNDGTEMPIEIRPVETAAAGTIGLHTLRQVPVSTPAGVYVPLADVARVRADEGRGIIQRTAQSRRVIVSYRFAAAVLESQPRLERTRHLVRAAVHDVVLPDGYSLTVEEVETDKVYYWMMAIAAILVYMVLASLFESLSSPLIIFATLPTAIIGSCWALLLSGTGLTSTAGPMALLGFIVLLGIAVNNGIILIDAINTLRTRYGYRRERAVLAAGLSRVRPILMTSSTTLLGVLPLALQFGGDYEIWPPFAITVFGGLAVSMVSTLIFLPVAYMGLDQVTEWLRRLGVPALGGSIVAAMLVVYAIHVQYDSLFWTSLAVLPVWAAFLAAAAAGQSLHRARQARRTVLVPVRQVELRTLTKAYGAPGKLRQEWARFERRARRLRLAGLNPVDREGLRDSLWWKVPLLGLLIFLNAHFRDPLWLYLLALGTWSFVLHLADCVVVVIDSGQMSAHGTAGKSGSAAIAATSAINDTSGSLGAKDGSDTSGSAGANDGSIIDANPVGATAGRTTGDIAGNFGGDISGHPAGDNAVDRRESGLTLRRLALAAGFLTYLHLRLGLPSLTVATLILWLALVGIRRLNRRVLDGTVDPDSLQGRLAWLRRSVHRAAASIPILGIRRPPFLALDGVNLSIDRGMFGLLGPNGAGKTTLLRIVSQVLAPTSGSVLLDGVNVTRTGQTQGLIGYLPQHFGLYDHMKAGEYLEYRALLEGFRDPVERRQRVQACLQQVNLIERRDDLIGSFSGGMRQRVGIAQTLLHMPRIVVVDEPTAGLDPVERIRFRNLLARISRDRIVIFSTHIVEDIAGSCNRLAVLDRGGLLYTGTPDQMRVLAAGRVWEAVVPAERFSVLAADLHLVTYRRTRTGVRIRFLATAPPADLPAEVVEPTLEDAYIHLLDGGRQTAC